MTEGELPRLILIADRFTEPHVAQRIDAAVRAGVPWVHLRDHFASLTAFASAAKSLIECIRAAASEVLISVNGRLSVAVDLGVGFHTGVQGPTIAYAREAMNIAQNVIGYSAHDVNEACTATDEGAGYLFFSPIFPTESKPGQQGTGLGRLRAVIEKTNPVPVYALGGITPERVAPCIDAGAHGVAVLGGILNAEDPATAAQAYLAAVNRR